MKYDEYHLYVTGRRFAPEYIHLDDEIISEINKVVQLSALIKDDSWNSKIEKGVGSNVMKIRVDNGEVEVGTYDHEGWVPKVYPRDLEQSALYFDSMLFHQLNKNSASTISVYDDPEMLLRTIVDREHWEQFVDELEAYANEANDYDMSIVTDAKDML
jgi:hypothetical protein